MAGADFEVAVQEREDIRVLSLDGLSGEHDAFHYRDAGECPAEYDRKYRFATHSYA